MSGAESIENSVFAYEQDGLEYFKSSMSGAGGCVAVAVTSHEVLVGDTKAQDEPPKTYTHQEWTAFIGAVARGEFDLTED